MLLWTEDRYRYIYRSIYIYLYLYLYIYILSFNKNVISGDEWSALAAHSPRDQKVVMLFLTANEWQKLLFNNRHKE